MKKILTTCGYCGCGCNLYLTVEGGCITGVLPKPGYPINQDMLCFKGWQGHGFVRHPDRLDQSLPRQEDGTLRGVSWNEAYRATAEHLCMVLRMYGPDRFAMPASTCCINKKNYLAARLTRAVTGPPNIDHCTRLRHSPTVADLAAVFGSGTTTNDLEEIRFADTIPMIGSNTSAQYPLAYAHITATKKCGVKLITVDPRRTSVATLSDIRLAVRPDSNLAFANALMHVILFEEKGQDDAFINERAEHFDTLRASLEGCTPEWAAPFTGLQSEAIREMARLYAKGPDSIILCYVGVTQQVTETRTCGTLVSLVMLCGMIGRFSTGLIPLRGQNNMQGSCDMGALPETLPGCVKADSELGHQRFAWLWGPFVDEQSKKFTEIMGGVRDGSIWAAYIMGENPMQPDPDAAEVEAGLRNLDFLIVQDTFMTPTARLVDVILPVASHLEKQGTFTNTERRVQLINEVLPSSPGTRPDWRILCDVTNVLGGRVDYNSPHEIFNEIRQMAPSYVGVDYTRLAEEQGSCWPCPIPDHPGMSYLHAASFTWGRGLLTINDVSNDLGCATDETYPFTLITGRVSYHYHIGTMTWRSWALDREYPEAFLGIHPDGAVALRLKDSWKVRVTSCQDFTVVRLRTVMDLQSGTVFLPFHFAESLANMFTSHEYLDPMAKIPALKLTPVRVEEVK